VVVTGYSGCATRCPGVKADDALGGSPDLGLAVAGQGPRRSSDPLCALAKMTAAIGGLRATAVMMIGAEITAASGRMSRTLRGAHSAGWRWEMAPSTVPRLGPAGSGHAAGADAARRAVSARSSRTAAAAASRAAPSAIRAICQPGILPATMVCTWTWAGTEPGAT
jgi:hypothetical protein